MLLSPNRIGCGQRRRSCCVPAQCRRRPGSTGGTSKRLLVQTSLPGACLYVGMAPRHMANRTSAQNLRKRVRYHYRGNAIDASPHPWVPARA